MEKMCSFVCYSQHPSEPNSAAPTKVGFKLSQLYTENTQSPGQKKEALSRKDMETGTCTSV